METNKPILLVEDDQIDVLTIKRGFEKLDVKNPLVVFRHGVEAMDYLLYTDKDNLPTLILLDLNLPEMNGFEFLETIKSHPTMKRIPVVVITTSNNEVDKVLCYNLNVSGYFVKPIDYFTLLESIMKYWKYCEIPPL